MNKAGPGRLLMGLTLALCAQAAMAQGEPVVVKRPAQLRDAPAEDARSLGPLAVPTALTRLPERQGPWVAVRTAQGVTGWVHMFDIGAPGAAPPSGSAATGALRSITGFFNRGSAQSATNTGGATATIGIRGLGAEDIANARPNLLAVTLVESMRQDAAQAQRFANLASLVPQSVAALPTPAPPAAAARSNQGPGQPRGSQEPLN